MNFILNERHTWAYGTLKHFAVTPNILAFLVDFSSVLRSYPTWGPSKQTAHYCEKNISMGCGGGIESIKVIKAPFLPDNLLGTTKSKALWRWTAHYFSRWGWVSVRIVQALFHNVMRGIITEHRVNSNLLTLSIVEPLYIPPIAGI